MKAGSTKEVIFDTALALIANNGFDSVSIRDIANGVGIKCSSLYNHYTSKDEILKHFYRYYEEHYIHNDDFTDKAEVMKHGTLEEIVDVITDFSFLTFESKLSERMMLITKIIYTRKFTDVRAAEIYVNNAKIGRNHIEKYLDYGILIGRFKPFSTAGAAYAFISLYTDMGVMAFIQPNYTPGPLPEERTIKEWLIKFLSKMENHHEDSWDLSQEQQHDDTPELLTQ